MALELFEQDMVGVKGYDAAILDALRRHNVWIVSKSSNANTITHYVQASLKTVLRVARDLEALYPSAQVSARTLSLVSPIGRSLSGLKVLSRGLQALEEAGIEVIAAHQTPRGVDVQFVLATTDMEPAITALHRVLIEGRMAQAAKQAA